MCNENDDCLDPATALQIYHLSKNKYINVDHKRDIVVGTVLSSGLSRFGENTILSKEQARLEEYFNLSVKETIRSWSLMETIVSIAGLLGVLVLNQIV
jgi:hypothetical protein